MATRYAGGKNGAGVYQAIINCIPRHDLYIEAFAGSAAVFRHKLPARSTTLIERDEDQAKLLARSHASRAVTVLQEDAFDFLELIAQWNHTRGVTFVYLDPPYHHSARRDLALYKHELTDDEHHQLLHSILPALSDRGVLWALSGYRCAAYDDASSRWGWHRTDYTAATRRGPVIESLWTNYDPGAVQLHDYRYLGDDFRERERIARKIKRWTAKLKALPRREREAIMLALANTAAAGDAAGPPAGTSDARRKPSTTRARAPGAAAIARSGEQIHG